MEVNEIRNKDGQLLAFEIPLIGRKRAADIVSSIKGVEIIRRSADWIDIIRKPGPSGLYGDVFCEFMLNGKTFVIVVSIDPYAGDDRYRIEQKLPNSGEELKQLLQVFASASGGIGYLIVTSIKFIVVILAILGMLFAVNKH